MWRKVSNGNADKPAQIDRDSSKKYVYIRKDFTFVAGDGEENPAHWEWQEAKLPKDLMIVYDKTTSHDEALDDVYAALAELAEIITEGE